MIGILHLMGNGQNEVVLGDDNRDQLNLYFDNVFGSLFINSNGGESILFDNMEELYDNIKQYEIASNMRLGFRQLFKQYKTTSTGQCRR